MTVGGRRLVVLCGSLARVRVWFCGRCGPWLCGRSVYPALPLNGSGAGPERQPAGDGLALLHGALWLRRGGRASPAGVSVWFAKIALSPPGLLLRGAPVFSSAGASISRARRKNRLNLTGRQKENKQVKRAPLWCKKSMGTNPWSLGPVLAEKIRLCGENGGGISIISAVGIKETQGLRPAGGKSGEIYSKTANKTGLFEN